MIFLNVLKWTTILHLVALIKTCPISYQHRDVSKNGIVIPIQIKGVLQFIQYILLDFSF